jgi:3-oxoacyl-[acyl-carrier-protein] synthase II
MAAESIVITGAEVVTALGASIGQTWRAIAQGRCGMTALTALESPLPPDKLGGQAVDLPEDYLAGLPREVRYLKWTMERALAAAGAADQLPYPSHRCGFMLGTTLHGMRSAGQFLRSGDFGPLRSFLAGSTLESATAGAAPSGFAATTCSACSSSLGSIALGVTLLQSGELDLVVCGGYDTISEYAYGGFNSLRLVADGPLKPFAKDRAGMKLGEGYGIAILERAADARQRGAKVLAHILGWGESADAHHLTQPHPEGDGAARAIESALRRAGIGPGEIGLVAAHATGTPDNDAAEYAALSRVFGDGLPRVPVVGFKSHLGHTLGGAGAVEMILAMTAMREQIVPPCANISRDDVQFENLQLSTSAAKPARIGATLTTSLGFGGANTCIILGLPEPDRSRATPGSERQATTRIDSRSRDVFITGIGVIAPGAIGNDAFLARLSADGNCQGGAIPEEQFIHLLNARRVRRMSEQVKLTLAATAAACQHAGIADIPEFARDCCAILGSTHGSTNYSLAYYGEIVKQGLVGANPMLFAEGVPNACSAHLSLMLGVKGACQTIIGTRTAGLDALRLAALRIANGDCDRVVVAAGEEYNSVIDDAYRSCGLYGGPESSAPFAGERGFVAGSAAVALILESRDSMERRAGARAYGRVMGGAYGRASANDRLEPYRRVFETLGSPRHVISSANGTWIDRAELAALRRYCEGALLSSVYGHVPETFSTGPLIGIAGALLSGRMIRLVGSGLNNVDGVRAATGSEAFEALTALCTDYSRNISAVQVSGN